MNQQPATKDDLFEKSTMTFGEHLDELRKALMKAGFCFAIGLGIGLFFAADVVAYIQDPLQAAIKTFVAKQTLHNLGMDPDAEESATKLKWLEQRGVVYETVYVIDTDSSVDAAQPNDEEKPSGEPVEGAAKTETAKAEVADSDPAEPPKATEDAKASDLAEPSDDAALSEDEGAEELSALDAVPMLEDRDISPDVAFDPTKLKPMTIWRPIEAGLSSFQMEETFMIWLKAGIVIGIVAASPGIFYFIWQFIAAGLYTHERKYVYVYMPFSVLLFVSGVFLAFFLVLKYVLNFLLQFNSAMNVDLVPRLSNYVNFVLLLPIGFGIAFQLPLVMLFLQRIGLFETQMYVGSWRIAVLVIAILSMILTPADIYSMVALMVPLIFLYFLGIFLCKFMPKGRGIGSEGYDPA